MIQRGYERRHRQIWSATRWQTYYFMVAFNGAQALSDAGIKSPKDLLPLQWDKKEADEPSAAEVTPEDEKRMLALIERENKRKK